jgi:hypothetical protein
MTIKSFSKEYLQAVLFGDAPGLVETSIVDTSRWSIHKSMIFKADGLHYETGYSEGATEQQDERPFEFDADEIDCIQVEEVSTVVTVWVPVRK